MTIETAPIHVLVVDDEVLILHLLEASLEEGGYTVVSVDSSAEAIKMLDSKAHEFRAVVTDVNLGRTNPTGWDVARRARELIPDVPIVYMTGDSAAEWTSSGVPHSILVPKPFAPAQVVTAVSQLINAPGPTLS
jgi:CheY-like chemotaxis protein